MPLSRGIRSTHSRIVTSTLFFLLFPTLGMTLPASTSPVADDSLHLERYRGQVVYLDFWASWCVPCRKSFPWMMQMQKTYGDKGFVVLTVNLDKNRAAAQEFLESFKPDFHVVYQPSGSAAAHFQIQAMPYAILFGRDGTIRSRHEGFRSKETPEMENTIQRLLQEETVEEEP